MKTMTGLWDFDKDYLKVNRHIELCYLLNSRERIAITEKKYLSPGNKLIIREIPEK